MTLFTENFNKTLYGHQLKQVSRDVNKEMDDRVDLRRIVYAAGEVWSDCYELCSDERI